MRLFLFSLLCISLNGQINPVSLGSNINGHLAYGDANQGNKLLSWINPPGMNNYQQFLTNITSYVVNSWPVAGGKPGFYFYYGPALANYQLQPADEAAGCLESGLAWKRYSGSSALLTVCEAWVTWILSNGLTNAGWTYANMPCAASTYNLTPYDCKEPWADGTPTTGIIEADKAAALGFQLVKDWEISGNSAYIAEAIIIANNLVTLRNTSPDATHSPWPNRVQANGGAVIEAYTCSTIPELQLFDELIAQGQGSTSNYTTARTATLTWLLGSNGPVATNVWANYYEDVQANASNRTNTPALATAIYLIRNQSVDASWQTHATNILSYIYTTAALGGTDLGSSTTMAEQSPQYPNVTTDATAHWALANAELAYATNNATLQDKAFRSFNWITYMLLAMSGGNNGLVVVSPSIIDEWFRVGYTDVIPHFLRAMTLFPTWGAWTPSVMGAVKVSGKAALLP